MFNNMYTMGSVTKPPLLVKEQYSQWKVRMLNFLEGYNRELITYVLDGPYVPMVEVPRVPANEEEGQIEIPAHWEIKDRRSWSEQDKELISKGDEAMRMLIMAIPDDIFQTLDACVSAKDLWDSLQRQIEGGEKTQKNRRSQCLNNYHTFKANEGDSLQKTFDRVNALINECRKHKISRSQEENNLLFLNSLPEEWLQLTMSLQTNQDLDSWSLTDLFGVLHAQEQRINKFKNVKDVKTPGDSLALAAKMSEDVKPEAKKKGKAKAVILEESEEDGDQEDDRLGAIAESLALISKEMMKKKPFFKGKNGDQRRPSQGYQRPVEYQDHQRQEPYETEDQQLSMYDRFQQKYKNQGNDGRYKGQPTPRFEMSVEHMHYDPYYNEQRFGHLRRPEPRIEVQRFEAQKYDFSDRFQQGQFQPQHPAQHPQQHYHQQAHQYQQSPAQTKAVRAPAQSQREMSRGPTNGNCFQCGEPGHFANQCKNPKKTADFYRQKAEFYAQKSLLVTQEDWASDPASDEEFEKSAMFCGMAEVEDSDRGEVCSTSDSLYSNSDNDVFDSLCLMCNKNESDSEDSECMPRFDEEPNREIEDKLLKSQKDLAFYKRESILLTEERRVLIERNRILDKNAGSINQKFVDRIKELEKEVKTKEKEKRDIDADRMNMLALKIYFQKEREQLHKELQYKKLMIIKYQDAEQVHININSQTTKKGLGYSELDPYTGNKRDSLSSTFCMGTKLIDNMPKLPSFYKRQRCSRGYNKQNLRFENVQFSKASEATSDPSVWSIFPKQVKALNPKAEEYISLSSEADLTRSYELDLLNMLKEVAQDLKSEKTIELLFENDLYECLDRELQISDYYSPDFNLYHLVSKLSGELCDSRPCYLFSEKYDFLDSESDSEFNDFHFSSEYGKVKILSRPQSKHVSIKGTELKVEKPKVNESKNHHHSTILHSNHFSKSLNKNTSNSSKTHTKYTREQKQKWVADTFDCHAVKARESVRGQRRNMPNTHAKLDRKEPRNSTPRGRVEEKKAKPRTTVDRNCRYSFNPRTESFYRINTSVPQQQFHRNAYFRTQTSACYNSAFCNKNASHINKQKKTKKDAPLPKHRKNPKGKRNPQRPLKERASERTPGPCPIPVKKREPELRWVPKFGPHQKWVPPSY